MLLTWLVAALIPLRVTAGILGNESAAIEWFLEQVPSLDSRGSTASTSPETSAARTYFYVWGNYTTTASQVMILVINYALTIISIGRRPVYGWSDVCREACTKYRSCQEVPYCLRHGRLADRNSECSSSLRDCDLSLMESPL